MRNSYLFCWLIFLLSNHSYGQDLITLTTPYDKDTLETYYPMFSWNYMNIGVSRDYERYIFTLVEIKNDQSPTSALQVNTPIVRIEGVTGFSLLYPHDAPKLKMNQRYAWRIQRKLNEVIVTESESWEFILYKKVLVPNKYIKLLITPQNGVHNVVGEGFYFRVQSKYGQENLKISLERENGERVSHQLGEDTKLMTEYELTTTSEDCYYLKTIHLATGIYIIKAVDVKGNSYFSKFKVN